MCRKDKSVPLSVPHTLKVASERERVGKAGAVIIGVWLVNAAVLTLD
jgi:hypothetical protein